MPVFDTVLISAVVGIVCVFIGLIANHNTEKGSKKNWITALIVSVIFVVILCILANNFCWESDILAKLYPSYGSNCTEPPTVPSTETINSTETIFPGDIEVGQKLVFGTYEQDNNSTTRQEPIEWVVLEKTEDKILVLSTKALACLPYNEQNIGCTWATCSLREWLNKTFYDRAFSVHEKQYIAQTKVYAHRNPDFPTNPGLDTEDHIFLLSVDEVNQYLYYGSDRMCIPTPSTIEEKCYYNTSYGTCWWWLRTPGETSLDACSISSNGDIDTNDGTVSSNKGCVRPAMWLYRVTLD